MQVMRKNEVIRRHLTLSHNIKSKISVSVRKNHVMAEQSTPFWVNPCGNSPGNQHEGSPVSQEELIDNILQVTKLSQSGINQMKQDFFKSIYGDTNYDESMFGDALYDWLPSREDIPKKLGEKLPPSHLESITYDALVAKAYTNLQMIAAGLECVLQNEAYKNFKPAIEGHLKTILCEIHDGMAYRKIDRPPDVTRDIIPAGFRMTKDRTMSKMRDWIVFREFMNCMEYILEAFTYISKPSM